jgi:CRISPR-associated protein Cmr6
MDDRSTSYNLPYKTKQIVEEFRAVQECKNLGLLLDKFIPKSVFEKPDRQNREAGKAPWLFEIFRPRNEKETQNTHVDETFARNAYQRWRKMMESLGAETFELTLDSRMVIGLGGETVLETDLTLHHLYGIPIIPGSALKGLTRAYVAKEYQEYYVTDGQPEEMPHPSKSVDEDHPELKNIFGRQEKAGTVCFFDAMPLQGQIQFAIDIMNPHYPDYYRSLQSNSIKAPTNDQQPNPITFLTVSSTTFTFALTPRHPKYADDVNKAKKWLQEALQKYGVGGKTSAGYGYFKIEQAYTRPNIPQFSKGDTIRGVVVDEKTDPIVARYIGSGQASKCLQYRPFPTEQVLILIDPTNVEARQWKVRNESICLFVEERVEDNRILLICEPRKKSK